MGKSTGGSGSDSGHEVKSYPGPHPGQYSTTFSNKGNPDKDPGHGKVVVDSKGNVRYSRETQDNGGGVEWIE